MSINEWRKATYYSKDGVLQKGALSLPTIRKYIAEGEFIGERQGKFWYIEVDKNGKRVSNNPLVRRVLG